MAHTAYLPIIADRYGAVVRHIFVVGLDLTGIDMRAQVRLYGDVPGAPLVDLLTVANGNAQGLRLVEVTSDDAGLPTSHIELVINETTMEALPYAGEIGDVTTLAWDWQITIAGRKRRLAKGEFQITGDGVTGAEVAPINRIQPYGLPQRPVADVWSSARMTFGEDQVTVEIDGADLLAPLVKAAENARDAVKPLFGNGAPAASLGIVGSVYYDTADAVDLVMYGPKTNSGWGIGRSFKGNPGGNVMAIGLMSGASGMAIPAGADIVQTAGFAQQGLGHARYQYDATVDAAYVAANPRTSFISSNGRGFRLAEETPSATQLGLRPGDDVATTASNAAALQALLDLATGKGLSSLNAGRKALIPGGNRWFFSKPLIFNWRDVASVVDNGDMRRLSLEGGGAAVTELFYTGPGGASFTGAVDGRTLTVSAVSSGELHIGAIVKGAGVPDDLVIVDQLTGNGGTGTYKVSKVANVSSKALTSKSCALYISGHQDDPNGGVDLYATLRGFRLRQVSASARSADGIRTTRLSDLAIEDVQVDQFSTNLDMIDTIRVHALRSKISGCLMGVDARSDTYSQPNVLLFDRCDFGGIVKRVLRSRTGSNFELRHCGIEGCGDGTTSLVYVEGGPLEGGICFTARGCYIENHSGPALFDIDFNTGTASGTIDISANTIRRNANDRVCINEIVMKGEASPELSITIAANGFEAAPAYIPSRDRPVVKMSFASTKVRIHGLGTNHFAHQAERPDLSGFIAGGYGYDETVANARIGADGSLAVKENIAFVDKGAGPGINRLYYKVPPRSPTVIPATLEALGGPGSVAKLTAENPAYAEITTYNNGVPTDMALAVTLKGLLS